MEEDGYRIGEIIDLLNAESRLAAPDELIQYFAYDSRSLKEVRHTLFLALEGLRDGADFIHDAYDQGVRNFIVSQVHQERFKSLLDASFIFVENTLSALQRIASYHRQRFDIPVIGITGSNGKTIVKEWLYQLLQEDFRILRSPMSYNSQLGVALALLEIRREHQLAIIEAGVSQPNEMDSLQAMILPDIGVLTNLGHAHDEGFGSRDEKAVEKLKLFSDVKRLSLNPDYLPETVLIPPAKRLLTWGSVESSDIRFLASEQVDGGSEIRILYEGKTLSYKIPFSDPTAVENSLSCFAAMLNLDYKPEQISERMPQLQSVDMRLSLKTGINRNTLIDDSYSNDLTSMDFALNFLRQQKQHPKHAIILSDRPALGHGQQGYMDLAERVQRSSVDLFIGVGPDLSRYRDFFPAGSIFFTTTEDLVKELHHLDLKDTALLIKGARVFGFERISKSLSQQVHDTRMEVNLKAIEHNFRQYRRQVGPDTKIMAMVKALSYGSGSYEIANLLHFNQVDYLAVAYPDEGVHLRRSGIELPILVMNPDAASFDLLIEYRLEPEIYSLRELSAFGALLKTRAWSEYPVHIKLNTGMNRLGFDPEEMNELAEELKGNSLIKVKSVFSHLVASGAPQHDDFTRKQVRIFESSAAFLKDQLGYPFFRHIANTAAISRFPEARFEMVRIGIGLYGLDESSVLTLEPVVELKSSITQIHRVKRGDTVGYNRSGLVERDGSVAVVEIGYADGYDRRFGNGVGTMKIGNELVQTIGDICMDMCMVDVTNVPVAEGDEVLVMGGAVPISELSRRIGTIPYEMLTGISSRVKRIYYYD